MHKEYLPALQALRRQLADLDDKRGRVVTAIAAIENLPDPADDRAEQERRDPTPKHTPRTDDSPAYADAALAVLREQGKPLHIDVILQRAQERGWYGDKDFSRRSDRNSFLGALDRNARNERLFYKPEAATYGLLEWRQQGEQVDMETPTPDDAGVGAGPNHGRQ